MMMRTAPLIAAAALLAPGISPAAEPLDTAIRRQMKASGPVFAPAHQHFIRERCGMAAGARVSNVRMAGDVLTCPDGRRVSDPQVRVVGREISARAKALARALMASPEVRAAMSWTVAGRLRLAGLTEPR